MAAAAACNGLVQLGPPGGHPACGCVVAGAWVLGMGRHRADEGCDCRHDGIGSGACCGGDDWSVSRIQRVEQLSHGGAVRIAEEEATDPADADAGL